MCRSLQFSFFILFVKSRFGDRSYKEIGITNPANNGESLSRDSEIAPTKKSGYKPLQQ